MSDWRLQGQEKYLYGVKLTLQDYTPYSLECDHDHCEFCGKKFHTAIQDAEKKGYCTTDRYRWICIECYKHFKEQFHWN